MDVPEIKPEVAVVVEAYTKSHYGNLTLSEAEETQVMQAWLRIRRALFRRALHRRPMNKIMAPRWEETL